MFAIGLVTIIIFAVSIGLLQSDHSAIKTFATGVVLILGGIIAVEIMLLVLAVVVPTAGLVLLLIILGLWAKRLFG